MIHFREIQTILKKHGGNTQGKNRDSINSLYHCDEKQKQQELFRKLFEEYNVPEHKKQKATSQIKQWIKKNPPSLDVVLRIRPIHGILKASTTVALQKLGNKYAKTQEFIKAYKNSTQQQRETLFRNLFQEYGVVQNRELAREGIECIMAIGQTHQPPPSGMGNHQQRKTRTKRENHSNTTNAIGLGILGLGLLVALSVGFGGRGI